MRKLPLILLTAFGLLSALSRLGLSESGKRQELTVRGIQRSLEQRQPDRAFCSPQAGDSSPLANTA